MLSIHSFFQTDRHTDKQIDLLDEISIDILPPINYIMHTNSNYNTFKKAY